MEIRKVIKIVLWVAAIILLYIVISNVVGCILSNQVHS
jgi:hypothetical protein